MINDLSISEIKIGRDIIKLKKGDYIYDNGSCHQICSGDGRILKQNGFDSYRSLVISKTTMKNIDLSKLKKVDEVNKFGKFIKYYI